MKNTFALQKEKMCPLCSGCENDSEFDYCRACGYTVLPIANNSQIKNLSIPDEQIAREKKSIREMKQAIGSLYNKLDSKILTDLMKKCENLISALQHKKERKG